MESTIKYLKPDIKSPYEPFLVLSERYNANQKGEICMSYFSMYMPFIMNDDYDRSYPAPEVELLWRLDDLELRIEELIAEDALYDNGYIFADNDIRYMAPESIESIHTAERAMELAKDDLVSRYVLPLLHKPESPEPELIEVCGCRQITVDELFADGQKMTA